MRICLRLLIVAVATFGIGVPSGRAETGVDAWLRYPRIRDAAATVQYSQLPAVVVVLGDSPVLTSARDELLRGIAGMLGRTLRVESHLPTEPAFVLGTATALASAKLAESRALAAEGFHIHVAAASSATNIIPNQPTFWLPEHSLVNLMIHYSVNQNWYSQINISNLLDKEYFAAAISRTQLMVGTPRNVRVRVGYKF